MLKVKHEKLVFTKTKNRVGGWSRKETKTMTFFPSSCDTGSLMQINKFQRNQLVYIYASYTYIFFNVEHEKKKLKAIFVV